MLLFEASVASIFYLLKSLMGLYISRYEGLDMPQGHWLGKPQRLLSLSAGKA